MHSLTNQLTHLLEYKYMYSLTNHFTHSLTYECMHSLTNHLTHLLKYKCMRSLTNHFTHSLTYECMHSLTNHLTHALSYECSACTLPIVSSISLRQFLHIPSLLLFYSITLTHLLYSVHTRFNEHFMALLYSVT